MNVYIIKILYCDTTNVININVLYGFSSIFSDFESKYLILIISSKKQYVRFFMLSSLRLPIYMSNKSLCEFDHFWVLLKMHALPMFMTNMYIVQKLHTLYNLYTNSCTHSCKQTCGQYIMSCWKTDPTNIIILEISNILSKGKSSSNSNIIFMKKKNYIQLVYHHLLFQLDF